MIAWLYLILYFSFVIISEGRLPISLYEISTELMSKLRSQVFPQHSSFLLENKYLINITNISPIFLFPEPIFKNNDILFDDTLVTFIFNIYIYFPAINSKTNYFINNHFAQCNYDLIFIHHQDNSYELDYKIKKDTFKIAPSSLNSFAQFKAFFKDETHQLQRKLSFHLEKFIDNQLLTYPMDDCASRLNVILGMIVHYRYLTQVNIPLKFPYIITHIRINSIIYKAYFKKIYCSCQIKNVVIDIDYYLGINDVDSQKIKMKIDTIQLNTLATILSGIESTFPEGLTDYIQNQFDKYARETF